MSKAKGKIVVTVPNGWTTYLVDRQAWDSRQYAIDDAPPIALLDGMVKAGVAERLSQLQMLAMDDISINDDGEDNHEWFSADDEDMEAH